MGTTWCSAFSRSGEGRIFFRLLSVPSGEKYAKLATTFLLVAHRTPCALADFIVQWGIPKDPNDWKKWGLNKIKDDPVKRGNEEGLLSFAMSGPNARGSQIFVNLVDNSKTGNDLDSQGFSPFAILKNKEDLKYFANLNEASVKLDQMQAKEQGNAYFDGAAPGELAKWKSATVIT